MPAEKRRELVPSANRLVSSLRDIGYDLPSAVADLIDNSITAGSTTVRIDTQFHGANSWIRIADNGCGMTEKQLTEAMRFGTRRNYTSQDLGKFGLGLKSASLSQCRCMTVATRTTQRGPIRIAQWDLDHVQTTDRWEVRRPSRRGVIPEAIAPLRKHRGTIVLWERLDRVLRYRLHDGQRAKDGFEDATQELAEHLEMLFHRFIEGSARRRRPLAIYINGRKLTPWDPFAKSEPATYRLPKQTLSVHKEKSKHSIFIEPFVLPTEAAFSSPAAHRRAAGPKKWNRQQGFYFYRNDRMIQSGGWNRLRTPDEHVKLARISVDFPSGADGDFELNVSKTQVRIPANLRYEFSALASSIALVAQNAYRRPSVGYDSPFTPAQDPRVDAVKQLVNMVLAALEEMIVEELGRNALIRERLLSRITEMRVGLAQDLYLAVSSNGHAQLDESHRSPNSKVSIAG